VTGNREKRPASAYAKVALLHRQADSRGNKITIIPAEVRELGASSSAIALFPEAVEVIRRKKRTRSHRDAKRRTKGEREMPS